MSDNLTLEDLEVCKRSLTENQMSDVAFIDQAAGWSKDLTRLRARGPGDIENAMRSIERDYGIDYWTQWRLRYRKNQIRDIGVSIYMRLQAAYQAECERQMRKIRHEIEVTKAIAGPAAPSVVAAQAVVDASSEQEAVEAQVSKHRVSTWELRPRSVGQTTKT
jgi:hypothetical protein